MRILIYSNAMPTFFTGTLPFDHYLTGGWISSMIESLAAEPDIALGCCFPVPGIAEPAAGTHRGVFYCGVPAKGSFTLEADPSETPRYAEAIRRFCPDAVHLFGTESAAALPFLSACGGAGLLPRAAVHLQGICAAIAAAYEAGLPERVLNRRTLRDLLRRDGILAQKANFEARAKNEALILRSVAHAIGRTGWDRAQALAINPNLVYHACNESLRDGFYRAQWNREAAAPHTIFFSQGNYPLKGLHTLLPALPRLAERFPDVRLVVAGGDPTRRAEGLRGRLLIDSYGAFLREQIARFSLKDRVEFTGPLDEAGMLEKYLGCGVFVSSSALENSPNSVAEAMLLGVPLVATSVGGVPSMAEDGADARLVAFNDVPALADAIADTFEDTETTDRLRMHARERALVAHDRRRNAETLIAIYREICGA